MKTVKNIIETNESKSQNKEDFIQMIYCSKTLVALYTLNSLFNNIKKRIDILEIPFSGCFELKNERGQIENIFIGEKGIKHYIHFSVFPSTKDKPIFEDESLAFTGGIKINNKYLALTSNSIIPYGKDILMIYDTINKKIFKPTGKIKYLYLK